MVSPMFREGTKALAKKEMYNWYIKSTTDVI